MRKRLRLGSWLPGREFLPAGAALLVLIMGLARATPVFGQPTDTPAKLRVGIKTSPPFLYEEDGQLMGISVRLWENIAEDLELEYEYVELDLTAILHALRDSTIDLSINPLTVTSERITAFDFTQPYFTSRSAVALRAHEATPILDFLANFFSFNFLKVVLFLVGVLLVFGLLVWLFERRRNPEQFPPGWRGIASGIWWSAVTMTTVGYGDKAPASLGGRIIAVIWMFTAIIIISGFTAAIASALTVDRLDTPYEDISDLRRVPVGTLEESASAGFLLDNYVRPEYFATVPEGLKALREHRIDAFVYDEPILRYYILRDQMDDVELMPETYNTQYYSFGMPKGSPLRERINPLLLEEIEKVNWKALLSEYELKI